MIKSFKNYLLLPTLFLIVIKFITSYRDIKIIISVLLFSLFIADIYAYLALSSHDLSIFRQDIRNGVIFINLGANEVSAYYTYLSFLPLCLFTFTSNKPVKLFSLFIFLFTLFPIAFLFSRGAYIGFLGGLIYFLFKKKFKIYIILLILISFFYTKFLPNAVVQRITMTEYNNQLDQSAEARLIFWKLGINQFLESPLWGKGFGSSYIFRGGDLHNIYITFLSEQGIIGLILFLSILISTFSNGKYIYSSTNNSLLCSIGLFIQCMVISIAIVNFFGNRWFYYELSSQFFVIMAISFSIKKLLIYNKSNNVNK